VAADYSLHPLPVWPSPEVHRCRESVVTAERGEVCERVVARTIGGVILAPSAQRLSSAMVQWEDGEMERHFETELHALRDRLLAMGSLAETMIHKGIKALVDRDAALVQAVLAHEEEMDLLCIEIDDRCFTLLALRQPMASDLRFLVSGIKINSDLERIGDQAVSIALRARSLISQPLLKPLIDIPRMTGVVQEMVRYSLDAFVRQDPDLARNVIDRDDEVDGFRDQIFRELLTYMMGDPTTIPRALDLILISRNLERIADHATNIAEDVIYIVRGEDVRERGDKELRKGLRLPLP
jgi:phosphate transport system protein